MHYGLINYAQRWPHAAGVGSRTFHDLFGEVLFRNGLKGENIGELMAHPRKRRLDIWRAAG